MNYKEIPINVFLNKYSKVLTKDDAISKKLLEKYPELEMDLISAKQNDNCSCHFKIKSFLEIKYFVDKYFLDDLFFTEDLYKKYQEYDKKLENDQKESLIKLENYKKIHIIKNDQKSWEDFQNFVRSNVRFQSFSVLQDGDNLKIYFL